MLHSLAKITIHFVFSTKNREPYLRNVEIRNELFPYMATILRDNVDSPALVINGVEDHIHALCLLSRKFPVMSVIQEMKTETSKWLKKRFEEASDFAWQAGYGAFSVSESNIQQVKHYIDAQEEHHKKMSFQDEFRALCEKHNVQIDERYAWD